MNLAGASGPTTDNVLGLASSLRHRGHVTVLKSQGGGPTYVDSFFDVFTEISLDGGDTYQPATSSTPLAFSVVVPEPSSLILCVLGATILVAFRRRRR